MTTGYDITQSAPVGRDLVVILTPVCHLSRCSIRKQRRKTLNTSFNRAYNLATISLVDHCLQTSQTIPTSTHSYHYAIQHQGLLIVEHSSSFTNSHDVRDLERRGRRLAR